MGRTLPRSDEVRAKERRLTDFVFHEVESKPAPGKAQGAAPAGRKRRAAARMIGMRCTKRTARHAVALQIRTEVAWWCCRQGGRDALKRALQETEPAGSRRYRESSSRSKGYSVAGVTIVHTCSRMSQEPLCWRLKIIR
jgi:hypothetical protein